MQGGKHKVPRASVRTVQLERVHLEPPFGFINEDFHRGTHLYLIPSKKRYCIGMTTYIIKAAGARSGFLTGIP